MRLADFVITAAVVAGLSAPAMAQTPNQTPPVAQPAPLNVAATSYTYDNHWLASAFVGTNFRSGRTDTNFLGFDVDDSGTSITFGGQVAYLWRGIAGAEGLVEFSPSFRMNDVFFENNPDVNTYMANGIAGVPLGENNRYFPYVSGGFGAVQLRSTVFDIDPTSAADLSSLGTLSANGTRFGGNIGGGFLGFSGSWGFRGDVRYYKTSVDNNLDLTASPQNQFAQGILSGLAFWKANVGVAYRW